MTTLQQIGERELIRRLARLVPTRGDVRVGIGDDVAVVHVESTHTDLLLTSDAVIEGVHFTRAAKPELIGRKAIGRVLSDLAAMGGEPMWALVDLVAPASLGLARIEAAYRGAARLAEKYGLAIVGGDTTQGRDFELHVFGVGQVPGGSAILRSGARKGDAVYVTGSLGGSLAGRHLTFEPRIAEGLWLREGGWASAMIDISDGLAADLSHLLEMSGVGAEVEAARVPVSKSLRRTKAGLARALFDGEDFELLFTVSADRQAAFESSWADTFGLACTRIGRIAGPKSRLMLVDDLGRRHELKDGGFEHFRRPHRRAISST